jgi:hypothetical protein
VATAAELQRDRADVDGALAPHRHPPGTGVVLLDDGGDLRLGGAAQHVDHPLDRVERDAAALGTRVGGVRQPATARLRGLQLGAVESRTEDLQRGERLVVVDPTRDLVVRDTGGEQSRRDLVGLRCRARELEGTGVGQQACVQRLRDLVGELDAEPVHQLEGEHRRRGRVDVDDRHLAEARVRPVVVDGYPRGRGVVHLGEHTESRLGTHVEGHRHRRRRHLRRRPQQRHPRQRRERPRHEERVVAEGHLRRAAESTQREPDGERRAERIGVRRDVREQQHGAVPAHGGDGGVPVGSGGRTFPPRRGWYPGQDAGSASRSVSRGLRYGSTSPA